MSNQIQAKIDELKRYIELSNKALQDWDQEIEAIKQKKRQIKSYIKETEKDIEILLSTVDFINQLDEKEKPFPVKEKNKPIKQRARPEGVLKNISLKTETIKILKENPNTELNYYDIAKELLIRDEQDPNTLSKSFITSVLTTLKRLLKIEYVVRIDKDDGIYWRKA